MKLYTRRDMARLASIGVAGIATGGLAVEFPSSITSRVRHLNALKAQNWRASSPPGPTWEWLDDHTFSSTGAIVSSPGKSCLLDYFPMVIGQRYDCVWETSSPGTQSFVLYDSSQTYFDWFTLFATGRKSMTMPARTAYARFCCPKSDKDIVYLLNVTTGEYLYKGALVP